MNKYQITEIKINDPINKDVFYTSTKGLMNLESYLCKRFKLNIRFAELKPDLSLWYFKEKVIQLKELK